MSPRISRRGVLGAGAGVLIAGLTRGVPAAAPGPRLTADLFVFPAPGTGNPVFAIVTSTTGAHPSPPAHMRIHAGPRSWAVEASRFARPWERNGDRFFAGEVSGDGPGTRHDAVVVESGLTGTAAAWAESRAEDGSRFRVGTPFVAELLSRDPVLRAAYHTASPAEDVALFSGAFQKRLAAMAASDGVVADPEAHARRLAARLLPDVLVYRPDLPAGFSFASQNGRHPGDDAAAVAATVLTGAVTARASAAPRFRMTDSFPYFSIVGA
jgi:hypothetical protein